MLLDMLSQKQSTQNFISFLNKIPNFRIKLTQQEQEVISEHNNLLVLGRSGTGKTTCAILRLFATEVLFRYKAFQLQMKKSNSQVKSKFGPEQLDSPCCLHIVFATASPVLTNEVRRFYFRLVGQVKSEMIKKSDLSKMRKNSDLVQEKEDEKEWEKIESEEVQKQQKNEEKNDLANQSQKEVFESESEKDEEEEENEYLQNVNSFFDISDEQFPIFLTIRRLVLMIDGTLQNPFFARDENKKIIGITGNSEWHNELKGVVMINREFKEEQQQIVQSLTEKDLSSSSESEYEEDEDEQQLIFQQQEAYKQQSLKMKNRKKLNKGQNDQKMSFEIEYDYFLNYFFKPKCKAWCKIKPALV